MRRLMTFLLGVALILPGAAGAAPFRPRIGHAFGLIPRHGAGPTPAQLTIPVVYHGGRVMHGVRVHALFWAPAGYAFGGSPGPGVPGYAALINQFLTDAESASGSGDNVFSVLGEYPDPAGPGSYRLAAGTSIAAVDPFPATPGCVSPAGTATCVTDSAVEAEIARHAGAAAGLHDLWVAFLPPGVDECTSPGACATTDFAGYHSVFSTAHGPVVYAVVPDPTLELVPPPGSDPQGNPAAESAIDTLAHEVVEAVTDPEGVGWMDPNGFEVADRCETGPQIGQPLGYAANGSPYNQVIAGHQYLIQTMWSNHTLSCQLHSGASGSAGLPEVSLTQWSPVLRGIDAAARPGQRVVALLLRAGTPVAGDAARIGDGGRFRLSLRGVDGRAVGVGDDRDVLDVELPHHSLLIATGDGGNPFTASGWTGWYDLTTGYAVGRDAVQLAPCSQTGVLTLRVGGRPTGAPIDQCATGDGVATVPVPRLNPRSAVTLTSLDNRAPSAAAPAGGLVGLTVRLGEPGAAPVGANPVVPFARTGAAACTADLYWGRVRCAGLVPGERYRLGARARARAGDDGVARFATPGLRRGSALALRGSGGQVLSTLHVANLRVDLTAGRAAVTGGRCDPGAYLGPALDSPPLAASIGAGSGGAGRICAGGRVAGLPVGQLSELDDRSGGTTVTEVPRFTGTIPADDATLYGPFRALASTAVPAAGGGGYTVRDRVSLVVWRVGTRPAALRVANVNTTAGVAVGGLRPGTYHAAWTLHDRNGDTRTLRTTFVEAP